LLSLSLSSSLLSSSFEASSSVVTFFGSEFSESFSTSSEIFSST